MAIRKINLMHRILGVCDGNTCRACCKIAGESDGEEGNNETRLR